MSHDMIVSVKLEHRHKSFERARKHPCDDGDGDGGCGVSFLLLYLSLACCGRWEMRAQGGQKVEVCERRKKPPG
jgi:hypothetical protein